MGFKHRVAAPAQSSRALSPNSVQVPGRGTFACAVGDRLAPHRHFKGLENRPSDAGILNAVLSERSLDSSSYFAVESSGQNFPVYTLVFSESDRGSKVEKHECPSQNAVHPEVMYAEPARKAIPRKT